MGFRVLDYEVEDGKLLINVDKAYSELSPTTEVLVRAAIVRTLTQLPNVKYVGITVEDSQLYGNFRERISGSIREMGTMTERHNETEKTEMKEPSETPETFSESSGGRLIKKLIVLLVFLAAAFGGTWFLYGADVLTAFWIYGAAAGGILAVIIILSHFILEKNREK